MTHHDRPTVDQLNGRATLVYLHRGDSEPSGSPRRLAFHALAEWRRGADVASAAVSPYTMPTYKLAIAVLGVDAHPWVALVGLCDPEATEIAIHCACGRVDYGSTFASANRAHEAHRKGVTE